jgi:hypothetical protein
VSDVLEEAEKLLWGKSFTAQELEDKRFEMFPKLVAEIKRLQADSEFLHKFVDAPGSILEAALNEVKQLLAAIAEQQAAFGDAIETASKTLVTKDSAIARLRKIAIKHLAWAKFIETELDAIPQEKNYEDYREKYERDAAKELDLRVTQEAGYVERLETDYAKLWRMCYGDPKQDDATRVQAALTKIREGN